MIKVPCGAIPPSLVDFAENITDLTGCSSLINWYCWWFRNPPTWGACQKHIYIYKQTYYINFIVNSEISTTNLNWFTAGSLKHTIILQKYVKLLLWFHDISMANSSQTAFFLSFHSAGVRDEAELRGHRFLVDFRFNVQCIWMCMLVPISLLEYDILSHFMDIMDISNYCKYHGIRRSVADIFCIMAL